MRGISAIGYVTPTSIQAQCIPPALGGRDICASAVTGSGKTAAFILPILERVIHMPRSPPASRALILTPTRELAAQCLSMTISIARYTSLTCCLIVGGSKNNAAQATELKQRPDLIIATPGRLLDHVQNAASFDLQGEGERVAKRQADNAIISGKNCTRLYFHTRHPPSVTTAIIPIPHPNPFRDLLRSSQTLPSSYLTKPTGYSTLVSSRRLARSSRPAPSTGRHCSSPPPSLPRWTT